MAEKRKRAKPIRRTTKGKGANYRPTKEGAGMTKKGVAAYRKANPDICRAPAGALQISWGSWTTETLIKVEKRTEVMEVKLSAIAERLEEIQIGYIPKSNEKANYKVTFTEEN